MSIKAYQRAATQAEQPRELEYRAFGQATAGLVRLKEGAPTIAEKVAAIDLNRRLWNMLSADCAAPENQLPMALRGQIISLALWVSRYSSEVLRDGADVEPLIDVNRTMMEGLAAR
ncbi:MAG TPA: flagellar biosynthesis regulator FlaF [Vitreimonas sp.]|uniref:flagellar biosynthesis regulator FlaF n=1 Tax=Vitreimonas sp. TaxID=3069702 RepID=UPI002D64E846|nr:flagellar biosynthesis regulator FlaF [Vitreimonas sp.]HYD88261.1 flagellar biosynthesis regulator FlaF [Vitreimonas sp.]